MSNVLVWFRNDLRIADNPAFHHACESARSNGHGVIATFLVAKEQWSRHDWGAMKSDFVLRNVAALARLLAALNITLHVRQAPRFDDAPNVIGSLIDQFDITDVYFNNELEINERNRDKHVTAAMTIRGVGVHVFDDQTVIPPGQVRTKSDGAYTVFTPFKKRWIEHVHANPHFLRLLPLPPRQPDSNFITNTTPAADKATCSRTRPDLWPAGIEEAGMRLMTFVHSHIDSYDTDRDIPGINGTSTLSPYLAAGVISVRQCLAVAIDGDISRISVNEGGRETWISELIWREFYKHLLIGFPDLCKGHNFRRNFDSIPWRNDESEFKAWTTGRTGYPIVDAGMRQLNQTGWMHNRLRMITAMFLTKHLLIDWRWGERYFMQHLVDADYAANNGGWQWSASTGTDAQPYFRVFNPWTQSKRFDPQATYIKRFIPELKGLSPDIIHNPDKLAECLFKTDYPNPIVDHKQARERAIQTFRAVNQ